jgi:23S rRNA (adenine2503-C2)-methyltransferase
MRNKYLFEVQRMKDFANGVLYISKSESDGQLIETTDTFLPYHTIDMCNKSVNNHELRNEDGNYGNRCDRWMIGVSVMTGCPCKCKFCATGGIKQYRKLSSDEIIAQIEYIIELNSSHKPQYAKEFKINYTRMGEPFLNIDAVMKSIEFIDKHYSIDNFKPHHYVSTIGINGSNFEFIKDNITLQLSLHSLNEARRNNLIPFADKMTIEELGKIRTKSAKKTTLNLTLADINDFDIKALTKFFDKDYFFIKLSPINPNLISDQNGLSSGVFNNIGSDEVTDICRELAENGYDYAIATATDEEIAEGAACGQLSSIVNQD